MRFLMGSLTIIWVLFGWVCFSAVQWEEPLEPPWHAAENLEQFTPDFIETKIAETLFLLSSRPNMPNAQKADCYHALAYYYWLKAYMQDTRAQQIAFLELAAQELYKSLKLVPKESRFLYAIGDIFHQLKDYKQAEKYYLEAFELNPNNGLLRRRYEEMLEESGLENHLKDE